MKTIDEIKQESLRMARRSVEPVTPKGQPDQYGKEKHKIENNGKLKGIHIFNNG